LVGEFLPGVVLCGKEGFDARVVDVEVEGAAFVRKNLRDGGAVQDPADVGGDGDEVEVAGRESLR
jgi:hypothetical protein